MITSTLTQKLGFLPGSNTSVVSTTFQSDLSTLDIAARFAHLPGTVLLASGGKADCARYTILGVNPWLSLKTTLTHATIESSGKTETIETDPLDILQYIVRKYKFPVGAYPLPIASGLLGYLSYDLKDCIEVLPRTSIDDLHLPHMYMVAPSVILVEDRFENRRTLHVSTTGGDAAERRAAFEHMLAQPVSVNEKNAGDSKGNIQSCFTREEYMRSIDAIRDYIVRGHVYQVNMSQRFETTFDGDAYELFVSLFNKNPAPFFAYVNAGDHFIVSTSPERFIELRGKKVETRPIKGTKPRGKTVEEDAKNRDLLLHSRKDDAELSMIVDLLRNDIGKACSAGSVKVREHKRIEAYENVFHLVSIIDGELDVDKDEVDLIRATFPGGSITGCPKIRSMEIIDELEPVRRHLYTGSIGYIGFHETMDFSIAIRTATIKDGRLVFSVGGGVVYDSDPADEYEETLHKGRTLMNAVANVTENKQQPQYAWYKGKFLPSHEVAISAADEGFLYGYGIYDTIRVQKGKPCRLQQHVDRFNASWKAVFGTEVPDVTWKDIITQVIECCGLENDVAAVKILAAAGKPGKPETNIMLVTARKYVHRLKTLGRDGVYLDIYPEKRYSNLASHKTMNYMFCKMATEWAKKQGADEAIIVNHDGSVCETTTANILCVIKGKWYQPSSDHVLPGTMESAVKSLLAKRGITVEKRVISVDQLKKADQVFITNALIGIVPVLKIGTTDIKINVSGLCEELNSALFS